MSLTLEGFISGLKEKQYEFRKQVNLHGYETYEKSYVGNIIHMLE